MVSEIVSYRLISFSYRAELVNLDLFLKKVIHEAEKRKINKRTIFKIRLSVEEAITNIISHGYPMQSEIPGDISIVCYLRGKHIFGLTIQDYGVPFRIDEADKPDTTSPLENRTAGGLGIHLLKSSTDFYSYHRKSGINSLTLEYDY